MPQVAVSTGVTLNYEITGEGEPLLLIMGISIVGAMTTLVQPVLVGRVIDAVGSGGTLRLFVGVLPAFRSSLSPPRFRDR